MGELSAWIHGRAAPGPGALLQSFMPRYDVNEVHTLRVRAAPARVYQAIHEVRGEEVRFLRPLFALRRLPTRLRDGPVPPPPSRPLLEAVQGSGFLFLAEEPGREVVYGIVGRFWTLKGGGSPLVSSPEEFRAFARPGYAKSALNFHVADAGNGFCEVTTETRILGGDAAARRKFGAYWRLIYPGSSLIRRMWLRAVAVRAQAT